jgi:nicotinamide mononucleotide transporter
MNPQNFVALLEGFAALLGAVYIVLISKKRRLGWSFGIASCSILTAICFHHEYYGQAIIQALNTLMGFYGWWAWNRPNSTGSSSPWLLVAALIMAAISYSGSFFFFPQEQWSIHLDHSALLLSCFATYLTVRMIYENWYLWLGINALTCTTAFHHEMYYFAGLSVVYLVLSFYGLYQWRK